MIHGDDPDPVPALAADLDWCLAQAETGAVWHLADSARQLDAHLVNLSADGVIELHREPDLEVLLLPLSGSGFLHTDGGRLDLAPHGLMRLPAGSRRAITAGPDGLSYLTIHRRRPGVPPRVDSGPALRATRPRPAAR